LREFIQPIVKKYKLRHPMSGVFVITSADRYKIPYAIQDENEHLTKELIVPANSLVYLHMRFKNNLGFTQHHFTFYFDGDRAKNPEIKEWFVPFVKEGENKRSPKTSRDHYIDYHGAYHIGETIPRAKGDYTVYSFNVATREPGLYNAIVEISADGIN